MSISFWWQEFSGGDMFMADGYFWQEEGATELFYNIYSGGEVFWYATDFAPALVIRGVQDEAEDAHR